MAGALIICGHRAANASFTFDVVQTGNDVTITGTGSLDTAGLTFVTSGYNTEAILANRGILVAGAGDDTVWEGLHGPSSLGAGGYFAPSTDSGLFAGINDGYTLYLPSDYVSDTFFTDSATYDNVTIAALGFTTGTYTYTFGSGATADEIIVNIGVQAPAPAPEPGTASLTLLPMIGLLAARSARRRGQAAKSA